VSFSRPRRRRLLMMARPARVRIRERNPCLRLRRRLLGWKVRFTVIPFLVAVLVADPEGRRTGTC
jgi:hypothetical protein